MIQLPRRSVTRFFIPLIDVLILLFSMFLLMPNFRTANLESQRAEVQAKTKDLERLKTLEAELAELKKKQGLAIRVLEVDPRDGRLFYYAAGQRTPTYVTGEAEARALIEQHTAEVAKQSPPAKLSPHFLLLMPRVDTAFPTEGQLAAYREWFKGAALTIDRPGGPR